METEIQNFIKVWVVAMASASYAYFLSYIPKGIPRLIFILPVIYLFIILPFALSSFNLLGPTTFCLVWLSNFKLLLYSFDLGPLSTYSNTTLPVFIAGALLPIILKHPLSSKGKGHLDRGKFILLGVKLVAFAVVVKVYEFRQELPHYILFVNQCLHLYLGVELGFALIASLAWATTGLDLDPQFDEPYLATSLQDFWGRRWNLLVSNILRLSVQRPIRQFATPIVGRNCGLLLAGIASFVVSGLMHEVLFYYVTRVRPTWEVTLFFVIQGVCTMVEIVVKEAVGQRFRVHRVVSGALTVGFVVITGCWLFLPHLVRNGLDVKAVTEYRTLVGFVKVHLLCLIS